MGSCIRPNTSASSPQGNLLVSSPVDNPFGFNITLINRSNLYFLLRKQIYNALKGKSARQSEFMDLREARDFCAIHSYLSLNVSSQLEPSVKVLYDFRNIILLDDEPKDKTFQLKPMHNQLLARLKELKVVPTAVMIFRWPIKDFLKDFPFLVENQRDNLERSLMSKMNIPVMLFDSDELMEKTSKTRIYLHSEKMHERNILLEPSFYKSHFNVKKVVDTFCTDSLESMSETPKIEQLRRLLKGMKEEGGTMMLLHRLTEQQDELVKIAMRVVCDTYEVSYSEGLLYFSQKFPNLISKATDEERQQVIFSSKQIQKSAIRPANKAEELEKLILKHYMECSRDAPKTSRAYSLCLMLLENIIREDTDSFRQVKTTNAQLGEHLFKFPAGRQLLESIGFFPQTGNIYRNDMEVKYLKTYRTDLEVAFRRYEDSVREGKS